MRSRVLGWSISALMSDDSAKTASTRRPANEPSACPPRRQCRKGRRAMSTAQRRSGSAADLHGELGELLPIHVGDQRVAQLTAPPEDHIEAARRGDSRHDGADLLEAASGPRQAFRAKHEQRDRVEPTMEHEDGSLAIEVVADGSSLQRELLVSAEREHGRKIEATLEPGLDLMDAATLDGDRMLARENPQMIVHRLGDHGRPAPRRVAGSLVVEGQHREEHRSHREGGDERAAPTAPPRGPHSRVITPLSRQTPLEREGGRMLRHPLLQGVVESPLDRVLPGALGAALEMSPDGLPCRRPEASALILDKGHSRILTGHWDSYLA